MNQYRRVIESDLYGVGAHMRALNGVADLMCAHRYRSGCKPAWYLDVNTVSAN